MKKAFIISFLFFSILSGINAQTGVARLEFNADPNSDSYHLIPCSDHGFLFFFETKDFTGEASKRWYLIFYDTELKESWKNDVPVVYGAAYQSGFYQDNKVYLFFFNDGRVKNNAENFQITTIDLATGIMLHARGNLPADGEPQGFEIHKKTAVIGLNMKNEQAGIFLINLQNSTVSQFIIQQQDQNFIEELRTDTIRDKIDLIFSNYLSRKQNRLYLVELNNDGSLSYQVEIQPLMENKFLNTARVYPADNGEKLIIGTYNNYQSKINSESEYFGLESAGMFITRIKEGTQQFMNYYAFMEFRNLRSGISRKDLFMMQKKKTREEPEYNVNYELVVHRIEKHNDQFILMAEAYYPDFRTESDIAYDYWGRPVTHTYTVFEGYSYLNSILAAFDAGGGMLWDGSIEMYNTRIYELRPVSDYCFDGNPVLIFYNNGAKITYRVFLENVEMEGLTLTELETLEFGDEVVECNSGMMMPWYEKYFICSGYQTIRNNTLTDKNKRAVYYINKISLE